MPCSLGKPFSRNQRLYRSLVCPLLICKASDEMGFVLPGCHRPGQWPLISWKPALRSGGRNRWGQGARAEKWRLCCWQSQSCPVAPSWPSVGADEGHVYGCYPSYDSKTSWVQITKPCHVRAWSSQQSCEAAGFISILQMKRLRARNDIIWLRSPRRSENQAVRV